MESDFLLVQGLLKELCVLKLRGNQSVWRLKTMRKGLRSTELLELTPEAMNEYDTTKVSHISKCSWSQTILH